ncbi:hypothetical protein Q5425_41850 [Amycolatopsis sp. A133]|uniref:hypothetical protein n=1 Tax=Amycolatopsis sp. A133 TaxID=3064472 RepID=UPI0027FC3529|nr:hypothetical protein [Amycolatopsis sp. A133]MDQ7810309.1 hypothetical protein [Amycolatopsis sp. A133]
MAGRDLADARLRRSPVGAWTSRRVTSSTLLVLFGAAAVWFTAVPIARNYLVGDLPAEVDQLGRLCGGGRPFGRSAAYAGPAPHPVVVFAEGAEQYSSAPHGDPAAVQLVGPAARPDRSRSRAASATEVAGSGFSCRRTRPTRNCGRTTTSPPPRPSART